MFKNSTTRRVVAPSLLLLCSIALCAAPALAQVVINEVCYDDASTDDLSFIELWGTPNMSLNGYTVQPMDQTCATQATYDLAGYSIQPDGYFLIAATGVPGADMTPAGILTALQNGPCDGVRLLLNSVTVDAVQYYPDVSLCATRCAEGEPARRSPSGDYSISRSPDRIDTGDNLTDFCPSTLSPHGVNACYYSPTPSPTTTGTPATPTPTATYTPTRTPTNTPVGTLPPPPDVKINEISYDDVSTDDLSFIELHGPGGVSLDYFTVQPMRQDCSATATYDLMGYIMPADGFFVIGMTNVPGVDRVEDGLATTMENGPCDGVRLVYDGQTIDAIQYDPDLGACVTRCAEGEPAAHSGTEHSLSRHPDGADTGDNATDFCVSDFTSGDPNSCYYSPTPTATPSGAPSNTPTVTRTPTLSPTVTVTPAPTISVTPALGLVINEIYYNDPDTDDESYVEIFGPAATDLTGCAIQAVNQDCSVQRTYDLSGYAIPSDGFFVLGQTGVPNVDLIAADLGSAMQNGPCDGVWLVQYGNVLDAVQYDSDNPCANNCGEGEPALAPGVLYSVSRASDGVDTDNNLQDFCVGMLSSGSSNACFMTPTPGPVPAVGTAGMAVLIAGLSWLALAGTKRRNRQMDK